MALVNHNNENDLGFLKIDEGYRSIWRKSKIWTDKY